MPERKRIYVYFRLYFYQCIFVGKRFINNVAFITVFAYSFNDLKNIKIMHVHQKLLSLYGCNGLAGRLQLLSVRKVEFPHCKSANMCESVTC